MEHVRGDLVKAATDTIRTTFMLGSGLLLVTSERAWSSAITLLNPMRLQKRAETAKIAALPGATESYGLESFLQRFFAAEGLGRRFSGAGFVWVKGGRMALEANYGRHTRETQSPQSPGTPLQGAESITGALPRTAADMGKFMIALLEANSAPVQSAPGAPCRRPNYRQQFLQHPRQGGPLYEFLQTTINGRRVLCHVGGRDHRSLLYLLPEEKTGFYVVVEGGDEQCRFRITTRLAQKLMDRMFPESAQ